MPPPFPKGRYATAHHGPKLISTAYTSWHSLSGRVLNYTHPEHLPAVLHLGLEDLLDLKTKLVTVSEALGGYHRTAYLVLVAVAVVTTFVRDADDVHDNIFANAVAVEEIDDSGKRPTSCRLALATGRRRLRNFCRSFCFGGALKSLNIEHRKVSLLKFVP